MVGLVIKKDCLNKDNQSMKQIKFRTLVEKCDGKNKISLRDMFILKEQPVTYEFKDTIGKAVVEIRDGQLFADIELDPNNDIVKRIIACSEDKIPFYPAISMKNVIRDENNPNLIIGGELTSVSIQTTPNEDKTIPSINIKCE